MQLLHLAPRSSPVAGEDRGAGYLRYVRIFPAWAGRGARLIQSRREIGVLFVCCVLYTRVYSYTVKHTKTQVGLLQQIANIERMEPGKLCVIGQGKDGPYYNLQCRENGAPVSRYVAQDQVERVKENTENYRTFQALVEQYAQQIITRTREERLDGKQKGQKASSEPSNKISRV